MGLGVQTTFDTPCLDSSCLRGSRPCLILHDVSSLEPLWVSSEKTLVVDLAPTLMPRDCFLAHHNHEDLVLKGALSQEPWEDLNVVGDDKDPNNSAASPIGPHVSIFRH